MPYITAAVLAGTAIYGAVEANDRKQEAKSALKELAKKQPKYRTAESITAEAEQATPYGYTPSERANFQQSMTRRANAASRIANDRNPNLGSAINAGINYGNIQGNLAFAADDSRLRQSKIRDYVGRVTNQSNLQTNSDLTSKLQQEIAYGNAKQQANADIYNSIMQLGYAGASAAKASNGTPNYGAPTTTAPTQSQGTQFDMTGYQSPYQGYNYDPYAPVAYGTPPRRMYNPYSPTGT